MVVQTAVFWIVKLCILYLDTNFSEEAASVFRSDPEDRGSMFLENVGVHLNNWVVFIAHLISHL
jgi:hypothetical protein